MRCYRLAGQDIHFSHPIPELEPCNKKGGAVDEAVPVVPYSFIENKLTSRTIGWVGNAQRSVEVYDTSHGTLLKVEGGGEFFIAPHGETISKLDLHDELSQLDREIILGPVLVMALALRDMWSLHASAVMYKNSVFVFLGESGLGKSTLAQYLSQNAGWQFIADDILPLKLSANGAIVLPHFPQLKIPMDAQPGVNLPEHLPLKFICLLTYAKPDQSPELQNLSTSQAVQALLSHIAGTRMFGTSLLAKHLDFSAQVAKLIPAYRLIHPHRRDTLPIVREFLEIIC